MGVIKSHDRYIRSDITSVLLPLALHYLVSNVVLGDGCVESDHRPGLVCMMYTTNVSKLFYAILYLEIVTDKY